MHASFIAGISSRRAPRKWQSVKEMAPESKAAIPKEALSTGNSSLRRLSGQTRFSDQLSSCSSSFCSSINFSEISAFSGSENGSRFRN
jgi:hypothetical protein